MLRIIGRSKSLVKEVYGASTGHIWTVSQNWLYLLCGRHQRQFSHTIVKTMQRSAEGNWPMTVSRLDTYRDPAQMSVPRTMDAVVLSGTGFANLSVGQVPVPEPGPNQLLARVDAAGVCSSLLMMVTQGADFVAFNGWDVEQHPIILGDEGTVTIAQVGDNLAGQYEVGQRFAVQPAVDVAPINHRDRYRDNARGINRIAVGGTLPGLLAQYILITEETLAGRCLVRLPDKDMPYFAAALAEPIACVYAAQQHHVHFHKEDPLAARVLQVGPRGGGVTVVIGAGAIGRMHVEMALPYRPRVIVLSDIVQDRLDKAHSQLHDKAARCGVELITVTTEKLQATVNQVSEGKGADDVILAVGSRAALEDGLGMLAKGGVADFFSALPPHENDVTLDSKLIHYTEAIMVGTTGGQPSDLAAALDAMISCQIEPGNYVFGVGGLEHCPQVIKDDPAKAGRRQNDTLSAHKNRWVTKSRWMGCAA
jgi:threonine dehydrogenase-like Zn-dependent dehydrogenase